MNASLHSIVSAKKNYTYVIKYKLANDDENYAQMRLHRYTKNGVYLRCCHKSVCKAKISFTIISPLVTEQIKPKLFKLSDQVTEDEIINTKNYVVSEHKCMQCSASKDENGFCDVTRHDNKCLQKVPMTTKVCYMRYYAILLIIRLFLEFSVLKMLAFNRM